MGIIRDFLTRYSFDVNDGPLTRMNRNLATLGQSMQKAFTRGPIDAITGKAIDAEKAFKNLSDQSDKVAEKFKALAIAAAAIGAGAAGLFYITKATADFADSVKDTSEALGVTTDALQQLRYAATLSGGSVEMLDTALKFLNNSAADASKTGKGPAAEAFNRLGVSARFATGQVKDVETLLLQTADAFAKMRDGPEKAALAMDIFGRDGAKLLPFLRQGSKEIRGLMEEAVQLGLVLDADAIQAAADFNDGLDRLKFSAIGLRNAFGSQLIPIFNEFVVGAVDFIKQNRQIIGIRIKEWTAGFANGLRILWQFVKAGFTILDRMAQLFGGWESATKKLIAAFALFFGAKTLIMIGSFGRELLTLAKYIRAVGIATASAEAAALAMPLAIGAAIALVALLIDDIISFFTDPEVDSLTGDLVAGIKETWNAAIQFIQDGLQSIKDFIVEIGASILEDFAGPLERVMILINRIIKGFTGIDALAELGIKTGEEGKGQRRSMLQSAVDFIASPIASYDTGQRAGVAIPPSTSSVAGAAFTNPPNVTIQNDVQINANGLSEQAAKELATREFEKSQQNIMKRVGNNSLRQNLE